MAANRIQLQNALHKPYDRVLFARDVLSPIFSSGFTLSSSLIPAPVTPNKSESDAIDKVWIYGNIQLDDSTEIICYEVQLQPKVRIEHSKVAIQQYMRKLLTAGQAALINFVTPANKNVWRFTLVAKDSVLSDKGVKEKTTNAKRYTYLLGPSETCKTAAERFEMLSTEKEITFQILVSAFSVEKLSKAFFDEYTLHYLAFCDYLQESNYRKSIFNISFPSSATKQEKDKASKPIRDFVKKLLGRIVFLYFVQKKGWLGANDNNYSDGQGDFIKQLFNKSGGNDAFYSNWLTVLFFDTLNKERINDDFKMPDGKTVKVPFLNGGLFDKEEFDDHLLIFKSKLFHHPDFEEIILTAKSNGLARGFLDFLDSFNFTVYEDSPDDHTVAVDPEMLGHIFENLLEDNKDKGAFYTPKEIVHYMCQESLTEYLSTTLQIKDEVAEREAVNNLVKNKAIDEILKPEINKLEKALDNVKICDPAIGSGAFPMGLLQEIYSIKELIAYETGKEWKPAETKLNIIQNSIYGVDIEKGAVDIARLRFWLSLVVDEEKPKALPNLDYKIVVGDSLVSKFEGEIIEIDWERKSSVGKADTFVQNIQRLLKEIAEEQKKFFKPATKDKKKLQANIRNLKLELLINQLSFNKEVFETKNNIVLDSGFGLTAKERGKNFKIEQKTGQFKRIITNLQNLKKNEEAPFDHFDYKLDFPEILNPNLVQNEKERGFDIVIANPPYIGQSGNRDLFQEVLLSDFGKSFHQRRMDYFYFFFHKAIRLSKANSTISFITTNYFLNATYADKLRKDLYENCDFVNLINFNEAKIFESATGQHNAISILTKNRNVHNYVETAITNQKGIIGGKTISDIIYGKDQSTKHFKFLSSEIFEPPKYHILIEGKGLSNEDNHKAKILNTIKKVGKPLIEFADIVQGIVSGANDLSPKYKKEYGLDIEEGSGIFVLQQNELNALKLNSKEKQFVKPWYKNSDVRRWICNEETNQYLIYLTSNDQIEENSIPNLIKHFEPLKVLLINRNVRTGRYSLSDYNSFIKGQSDIPYVMIKSSFKKGKYYLVSYARDKYVFDAPKIVCPQRSPLNTFGYTEKPWYGASDVYYIVEKQNQNTNLKFLLALLNSKLVYFWLYNKGQRKGENLQLFKDPLTEIPIVEPALSKINILAILSDYIIYLKLSEKVNSFTDSKSIYFERLVDLAIYELYFPEIIEASGCQVFPHLVNLSPIDNTIEFQYRLNSIENIYKKFTSPNHPLDAALLKLNNIPEIKIIEGKQ